MGVSPAILVVGFNKINMQKGR